MEDLAFSSTFGNTIAAVTISFASLIMFLSPSCEVATVLASIFVIGKVLMPTCTNDIQTFLFTSVLIPFSSEIEYGCLGGSGGSSGLHGTHTTMVVGTSLSNVIAVISMLPPIEPLLLLLYTAREPIKWMHMLLFSFEMCLLFQDHSFLQFLFFSLSMSAQLPFFVGFFSVRFGFLLTE